jgi:ubiquitin-like domain-containing CTD phosphatase 1
VLAFVAHGGPSDHILSTELEFLPDVVNDLDVDFSDNPAAAAAYKNDQRNIRKVKEATKKLAVNIIHPLREGKKLLVLDIDYSKLPLSTSSSRF